MQNCNSNPIKSDSKSKSSKIITFVLFTFIFDFLFLTFDFNPIRAFTMSNNNFIIHLGGFNTSSGEPTGSNYKLKDTLGGSGLSGSNSNFKITAGFEKNASSSSANQNQSSSSTTTSSSTEPFSFSISSNSINFGILSPTDPITRTNDLEIKTGSALDYMVSASENSELKTTSAFIPDTTCDNGACSEITSAPWENTLTYGFGYRCDNLSEMDCELGFEEPTLFKQFPNESKEEIAQPVMFGSSSSGIKKSRITYKINISGTQASGDYTNTITYIATPTY